jgi:hypothetical protein
MPHNGEMNTRFGVYKNLCCGLEIMLREGMRFPDCANHPKLTTIWKSLTNEMPKVEPVRKESKNNPAA